MLNYAQRRYPLRGWLGGYLVLLPLFLAAQTDTLDRAAWLAAAQSSYLPDTTVTTRSLPNFPLIRSYELRSETDEFDPGRQEFNLRFNLSTPRIRRAQQRLARLYRERINVERAEQVYLLRYAALEDWWRLLGGRHRQRLLDSLIAVQRDQTLLYERLTQRGELPFPTLLAAREQLQRSRLQRGVAVAKQQAVLGTYGIDTSAVLPTVSLPPVRTIEQALADTPVRAFDPRTAEQELDRRLNEAELNLQRAEQAQVLDFAQLGYSGPTNDPFRERFSVQAALLLTTDGDDRLKVEELRAERAEDAQALVYRQHERERRLQRLRAQLRADLQAYRAAAAAEASIDQQWRDYLAVRQRRGPAPLEQLERLERRYRFRLQQLERWEDLYATFLEWQFLRGD